MSLLNLFVIYMYIYIYNYTHIHTQIYINIYTHKKSGVSGLKCMTKKRKPFKLFIRCSDSQTV